MTTFNFTTALFIGPVDVRRDLCGTKGARNASGAQGSRAGKNLIEIGIRYWTMAARGQSNAKDDR